jgi:replicative DNA helicase
MAKATTRFVCQNCGHAAPKWMGRCPDCNEWNSLVEETVRSEPRSLAASIARGTVPGGAGLALREGMNLSYMGAEASAPRPITEVVAINHQRTTTGIGEFDRVLGGGIVSGSLVLIGGDPGIGKCLVGTERVLDPHTGDFLPITEWADGNRPVLALDGERGRLQPQAISGFLEQGTRSIVEVHTRLGRRLRCTPNHPLLTPEGWRPVETLAIGARIASPRSLPVFGKESLDENVVRLIAYTLSDGNAHSAIGVTSALPEVEEDVQRIAVAFGMTIRVYAKPGRAKQFRFVIPYVERGEARQEFTAALLHIREKAGISWAEWARRANVHYARIQAWRCGRMVPSAEEVVRLAEGAGVAVSEFPIAAVDKETMATPVARLLEQHGLRYSHAENKAVPSAIFRLPKAQMALFLKVLFSCDGSVHLMPNGVPGLSYSTISRRLAEDVQHLLLRFGFITKLRTKHTRVKERAYTAYEIQMLGCAEVKRFLNEIGIWGREAAKERIAEMTIPTLPSTHFDTLPVSADFWEHLREAAGGVSFKDISMGAGVMIRNRRHDRPLCRKTIAALAKAYPTPYLSRLAENDIYWDEISAITPAGEELVYDLTVPGAHNFVAGDLIVHNSTLLSKVAGNVASGYGTTLYVSGEESAEQIKMRADRLEASHPDLLLASETDVAQIAVYVQQLKPKYLIIDSIQTMQSPDVDSSPGTVSQVRASCAALAAIAKGMKIPVFLVGHVTKEGAIAGPRVLEHMVDTVLYFEGDRSRVTGTSRTASCALSRTASVRRTSWASSRCVRRG